MTPLTTPIFLFSVGHKRSNGFAYESDSVAGENQPFVTSGKQHRVLGSELILKEVQEILSIPIGESALAFLAG